MSRVGKNPVPVPSNVEVKMTSTEITVKGPLGTLQRNLNPDVTIEHTGDQLLVKIANNSKQSNAMSGTMRAL